jgi:hypothetical protein
MYILTKTSYAATEEYSDGIFTYKILDKDTKEVSIIKCTPDLTTTQIEIPSQVQIAGITYQVTAVGGAGLDMFYNDNTEQYHVNSIKFPEGITGTITNFDSYLPELKALIFEGSKPPKSIETTRLSTVIYVPDGTQEIYSKIIHARYEYSKSGLYETTFELEPNVVAIGTEEVEDNYFIKDNMIYEVVAKAGSTIGKVKLLGNYLSVGQTYLKLSGTVTNKNYTYQLTELGTISLCGTWAKWIFLPDTIKTLESYVFDDKVTHVFLSKNIKTIPSKLFTGENREYSLKFIHIPEGVTTISNNAFGSFYHIYSMILPSTINSIGENALASVKTIVFMRQKPVANLYKALGINYKAFIYGNSYAKSKVIKVAAQSVSSYQKAIKNYSYKATIKEKKAVIVASKININQTTINVSKGNKKEIIAKLTGKKANEIIQWNSANTNVATVSKNGVITGVKKGTTYVLAYTQTSGLYKIIKVVVK